SQIPNQIQDLVAHKLIWKTQRRVFYTVLCEYNAILKGSPSDQPHVAHGALVLPRTEGPRRSNGPLVIAVRKFCRKTLSSDQRMRKIDSVRNRVFVSWVHSNEFIAFA